MHAVPADLADRPFSRAEGLASGLTARVLEGVAYVRVHPRVYRHRAHEMGFDDRVRAAALALPERARTTGITRLRQLGLPWDADGPLRFVIDRDHHVRLEGVFLHRTVLMPATDDVGVVPTAAFVAFCATARFIDAVKVGDWLIHRSHVDVSVLEELCDAQPWRRGVPEARYVAPWLDGRCRSMPESTLFTLVRAAGLPCPEPNRVVELSDTVRVTPDLWFADYLLAVEVEGRQHQEERGQYLSDIDRYAAYRRASTAYLQVTTERLRSPRSTVGLVHRELVTLGYDGPPPRFDGLWDECFASLRSLVARQRRSSW